jgi:DNA-binding response OmpR family regulator
LPKILVIEDDPQLRREIVDMLAAAGHQALEAQDGRKGLGLFNLHRPTLVITAIVMPDMDGLETIKALRKETQRVAIIAVSSGGPPRGALYLNLAKMAGADEVMATPFSASELVDAVNRLA